jgi:hypothetical protein
MKKKKKGRRFSSASRVEVSPRMKTINLLPEEAVNYLYQAEQYAIPQIKEFHLPPAMACFLLAQYMQVLATGDECITPESAITTTTMVLTLWQRGSYTPGPEYPYTLEETLQDQQHPLKASQDYAESFQPLQRTIAVPPRGKRSIFAGLVQHPDTQLWQIWLLIDGPCDQLAAYQDVSLAQQGLQEIIALVRTCGSPSAVQTLCRQLEKQSDGIPLQIPFDMMQYLLEHLDRYAIPL